MQLGALCPPSPKLGPDPFTETKKWGTVFFDDYISKRCPPPVFRKTFLGYIVTKGLFSLQKDLCTFERDEKMFTILFSKVNVLSQKKKKMRGGKYLQQGELSLLKISVFVLTLIKQN